MIDIEVGDAEVPSLEEYRQFIKAINWLNDQMDICEEAEWLMLLIKRLHANRRTE